MWLHIGKHLLREEGYDRGHPRVHHDVSRMSWFVGIAQLIRHNLQDYFLSVFASAYVCYKGGIVKEHCGSSPRVSGVGT